MEKSREIVIFSSSDAEDETSDDYKSDEDPDFEPMELGSDEESELTSIDEDDDEPSNDVITIEWVKKF